MYYSTRVRRKQSLIPVQKDRLKKHLNFSRKYLEKCGKIGLLYSYETLAFT